MGHPPGVSRNAHTPSLENACFGLETTACAAAFLTRGSDTAARRRLMGTAGIGARARSRVMTLAASGATRPGEPNFALAAMGTEALGTTADDPGGSEQHPLRCPRCGAGPFRTPVELQEHIEAVHGNQQ